MAFNSSTRFFGLAALFLLLSHSATAAVAQPRGYGSGNGQDKCQNTKVVILGAGVAGITAGVRSLFIRNSQVTDHLT